MGRFKSVKTNNNKNSIKEIKLKVLDFDTLWSNYPSNHIIHSTKYNDDIYGNYCAVDLSEAFLASSIKLTSFPKKSKCWGECTRLHKHAFRAQDLATWLEKYPILGFKKKQKFTGATYEKGLEGKQGIVFFKDYWQRNGEKGRTGDHIDLWDNGTLASMGTLKSFVRIGMGVSIDGLWSDFEKAKEVLFWEQK